MKMNSQDQEIAIELEKQVLIFNNANHGVSLSTVIDLDFLKRLKCQTSNVHLKIASYIYFKAKARGFQIKLSDLASQFSLGKAHLANNNRINTYIFLRTHEKSLRKLLVNEITNFFSLHPTFSGPNAVMRAVSIKMINKIDSEFLLKRLKITAAVILGFVFQKNHMTKVVKYLSSHFKSSPSNMFAQINKNAKYLDDLYQGVS